MKTEKLGLKGHYVIKAVDADSGRLLGAWRFDNQLTEINRTVRTQMLMGSYTGALDALEIKYFAFGTGDRAVTVNDTSLQNEVYRKQITQISNPNPGIVQTVVSLGSQECNYNIREIGVFAGPNATAAKDSGTLLSRVLVNIDKNTNIVWNVVRTDSCTI